MTQFCNDCFRSSHRRCSIKKGVLENFTKFTGKHLYQTLFFNKVAGLSTLALVFCYEFYEFFENIFFPPEVFCKKSVLKNFTNFTGKQLCWSLFFIKLQSSRPATLLKRDSNTGVFLRNLRRFLRKPILKNICERLLFE